MEVEEEEEDLDIELEEMKEVEEGWMGLKQWISPFLLLSFYVPPKPLFAFTFSKSGAFRGGRSERLVSLQDCFQE